MNDEPPNFNEPWHSLFEEPGCHTDAVDRFIHTASPGWLMPAVNPVTAGGKNIQVSFPTRTFFRHFLFKGPDDTHDRQEPHSEKEEHHIPEHDSRINWVRAGLLAPSRLYNGHHSDGRFCHYYACDVSREEEFVVIVAQRSTGVFEFVTAVCYAKLAWFDKRKQYCRGPMYDSSRGPKKKRATRR